jgi:hypothetical protein
MLDLCSALADATPWLSAKGRRVFTAVITRQGRTGSAENLARGVGLTSRHQLTRLLRQEGLPQLQELSAWVYTLARLLDWEVSRVSLCRGALGFGEDPGNAYRRIQHLCGIRWSEARAIGFDHMLIRFVERCSVEHAGPARNEQSARDVA